MVARLIAANIERLLVVVPTDALRDQIVAKFERLGVLLSTWRSHWYARQSSDG
jgi:hypothetical protein